jgi:hypothetical protein
MAAQDTASETRKGYSVPSNDRSPVNDLLDMPLRVVNIGLESFADDLTAEGAEVVHVDWAPPAGGDPELAALLAKLGA